MDNCQHRHGSVRKSSGLSLVELLVATLVTLIGLVVITQVFAVYEGWKRTTTGVAQTQESGLLGAFAIEQDLRNAGFGIVRTGCSEIVAYNRSATPSTVVKLSKSGAGVSIAFSDEKKNTKIDIVYSSSSFANVVAKTQQKMSTDSDPLYVDNAIGIAAGGLILITDGTSCSVRQVSKKTTDTVVANVTSAGNSTLLELGSSMPWNPPAGDKSFPGYAPGTSVLNLGKVIRHSYYVQDQTLRMDEYDPDDGSLTSYDLISGVVGLRAQCLPATAPCNDQTTAVRFGLIVKSGNREKDKIERQQEVARVGGKASIAFWSGKDAPTLNLDLDGNDEALHYRYRVFQTVVPLKNIIWNK